MKKIKKSSRSEVLREKAEKQLIKNDKTKMPLDEADNLKLIHELQVHQIELEMINEELRIARDKAELNTKKYQELYDFAPSGYLTILPDGTISELNFSSAKMLGMERSQLIKKNLKHFIANDSLPVLHEFMKKAFEDNIKSSCELKLRNTDGTSRFVYIEGENSDDGGICFITMIDINARRIVEDVLNNTLAALERSNKDLEQFAYVASHDLQEPLRMVSIYTGFLEKQLKDILDDKTSLYMQTIVDGAKRMQVLIQSLLVYSRIATKVEEFVSTDLNNIMAEVLKDLQFVIYDTKADIIVDKLPVIKANSIHMHQLFQNLINNAIKFRNDNIPEIKVSVKRNGSSFTFSVKDNGIGIDPKFHDRIFLIFQRLNERDKYPGTGLGLSICKKIVDHYGGKIWVESEEGKGSTFYFTIPDREI